MLRCFGTAITKVVLSSVIIPLLKLHSKRFSHLLLVPSHEKTLLYLDSPATPTGFIYILRGAPDRKTWFYHPLMSRPQVYGGDKDDPQLTLAKPVKSFFK